jgi:hypothetical protein
LAAITALQRLNHHARLTAEADVSNQTVGRHDYSGSATTRA